MDGPRTAFRGLNHKTVVAGRQNNPPFSDVGKPQTGFALGRAPGSPCHAGRNGPTHRRVNSIKFFSSTFLVSFGSGRILLVAVAVQGIGWVLQGKLHTRWYNTPLGPGKIKRTENFILLPINQLPFSGGRSWHTDYLHTTVIPLSTEQEGCYF